MNSREVYDNWLADECIDEETKAELRSIADDPVEIEERFYKDLEFGTGGLRGILGAGSNRMNKYTVAKASQGIADHINSKRKNGSVAIAYDSRHMSAEFAEVTASVLNANGIKAYVFESLRPTPELSFTVRHLACDIGINVTASHNPAKYNGYKVYGRDGAQVTPPEDEEIMERVNAIKDFSMIKWMDRKDADEKGLYIQIGQEIDEAYMAELSSQVKEPELIKEHAGEVNVVYTPLHGAGQKIVPQLLKSFGFKNLHIVEEQKDPDGDFPTVQFPNPEFEDAWTLALDLGRKVKADVMVATDPDSDRMGVYVTDKDGNFHALTGNMTGCLLCEYELSRLKAKGQIPSDGYVVRSIVSSRLFDRIAAEYQVAVREVLTGFKWIGKEILESETNGSGTFLFGYEESYGYLVGTHARDKDACVSALAICEACVYYKEQGKTLWDIMQEMYERYGFITEYNMSVTMEGKAGLEKISEIMSAMRSDPPKKIAAYDVVNAIDYADPASTGLPASNVLFYEMKDAWLCVRPSGTEPKIKYYIGVRGENSKEALTKLEEIKSSLETV